MASTVTRIVPPAFITLADTLMATEETTDADLAQAGQLVTAAVNARRSAGLSAPAAQPIFETLEKVLALRFEGRRELSRFHSQVRAAARASTPDESEWGPDKKCPYASGTIGAAAVNAAQAAA